MESDEDSDEVVLDDTWQKSSLTLPHIKLAKDQYKAISRLAHNDKFAALPPKWLAKHPFPKWSILTKGTGKRFYWGLCWEWAGPLKFGLIAEGYEGVDELYSIISNVVEQLKSPWHFSEEKRKPLTEYSMRHHPYSFLMFTHTGNGMFQVTCNRILREHYDTLIGAKKVAGWLDQRNTLDVTTSLDTPYTRRLKKLRPETTEDTTACCDQEQTIDDSDNESIEF